MLSYGRIAFHVFVSGFFVRVAPLLILAHRERQRRVQHRVDDIDERHLRDDGFEQIGTHVDDRAHQQTACAAARNDEPIFRRVLLRDQVFGGRDEVGEGIFLQHHLALLVPLLAHFAAAANVRDGEDDAPIEQAQA